jgi:hypothetical protein
LAYRIRDWNKHFENNRTRDLKRMEWIPVPNKMDGSGYRELVDHENGAAHLGAWYALLEISSRQKTRGTIPQESAADRGDIPQDLAATCRCVSRISGLRSQVFIEAIPRLLQIGWLEELQNDEKEVVTKIPHNPAGKCDTVPTRAREWNGMEWNGKEETLGASAPAETLFPADPPSPVRSAVPAAPTFDDWWKVWWNHTAKAKTQKLWPVKAKQHGAQFLIDAAIADRQRWEPTTAWEWRSQLHPTTWLNGKRWEDELPPNGKSSIASMPARSQSSTVDRALAIIGQRIKNGERPV